MAVIMWGKEHKRNTFSSLVGSFAKKESTQVDFHYNLAPSPIFKMHLHVQMTGKQGLKPAG